MVSLAQAILQRDATSDEDELDREIERELAELRARRCQLAGTSAAVVSNAAGDGDQTKARPSVATAHARPSTGVDDGNSVADVPGAAVEQSAARPKDDVKHRGFSLAEELLKRPSAESEIAAMDMELEEQMAKLRIQMRGDASGLGAVAPAPDCIAPTPPKATPAVPARPLTLSQALGGAGSAASVGSKQPLATSSRTDLYGTTGPGLAAPIGEAVDDCGPVLPAELLRLQEEAARMEEAFPARGDGEEAAYLAVRRPRADLSPALDLEEERQALPMDDKVADMQEMLEGLDARLQAIQQRKILQIASGPKHEVPSHVSQAIAEMQAQNKHLRERMAAGTSGRLNLDASLFKAGPALRSQHA